MGVEARRGGGRKSLSRVAEGEGGLLERWEEREGCRGGAGVIVL